MLCVACPNEYRIDLLFLIHEEAGSFPTCLSTWSFTAMNFFGYFCKLPAVESGQLYAISLKKAT
jgi:hypothetical protein